MCCVLPELKKRLVALALAVCCLIAFLLSSIYLIIHDEHDKYDHHEAEGICEICVLISYAKSLLGFNGEAARSALFAFPDLFMLAILAYSAAFLWKSNTLVGQKIRMND